MSMRRALIIVGLVGLLAQIGLSSSVKTITLGKTAVSTPQVVTGQITLATPAPAAGQEVDFTTTTSYVQTPTPVVVPSGQTTANFSLNYGGGSTTDTYAVVSASTVGSKISAVLHIYAPRAIKSFAVDQSYLVSGAPATARVILTSANPAGQDINAVTTGAATAPTKVSVAPTFSSVTFAVTGNSITSNSPFSTSVSTAVGASFTNSGLVIPGWKYEYSSGGFITSSTLAVSTPVFNPTNGNVNFTSYFTDFSSGPPVLNTLSPTGSLLSSQGAVTNLSFEYQFQYPDGSITEVARNISATGTAYPYNSAGTALPSFNIPHHVRAFDKNPAPNGDLGFFDNAGGFTVSSSGTQTSSWTWATPTGVNYTSVQQTPSNMLYAHGSSGSQGTEVDYIVLLGQPDPLTHIRPILDTYTGTAGAQISNPVVAFNYVFVNSTVFGTTNGALTALNPDLSIKWQYAPGQALENIPGSQMVAPVVGLTLLYVVTPTRILAIRPANGSLAWQVPSLGAPNNLTFDRIRSAPDGTIYESNLAEWSGGALSVRALTPGGSQRWRRNYTDRGTESDLVVGPDSNLYFVIQKTNFDFYLLCFNASGSVTFDIMMTPNGTFPLVPVGFASDGSVVVASYGPAPGSGLGNPVYDITKFKWSP